jgi:hypothetical protein
MESLNSARAFRVHDLIEQAVHRCALWLAAAGCAVWQQAAAHAAWLLNMAISRKHWKG